MCRILLTAALTALASAGEGADEPFSTASWPAGKHFRDCSECPLMVVVPAGSFMMGLSESEEGRYDDEGPVYGEPPINDWRDGQLPVHGVTIGLPFAMGVYEVTVSEFDRFVDETGYLTDSCSALENSSENSILFKATPVQSWFDPGFQQGGLHPVTCVNWQDARAYVNWLSVKTGEHYRLPSESEWEYAARARTTGPFHTGSTILTDQANYNGNYTYGSGRVGIYRAQTVPVGSFAPNLFGLHDMHGNISEWVQDCYNSSYEGAPNDGSAWESGDCSRRISRGGSWGGAPKFIRSSSRSSGFPDYISIRLNIHGFRVARTLRP